MTIQIGDKLVWRQIEHTIPDGGPLLEAWPEGKKPKFRSMSTACWRGFIATWIIDDENWLRVASVKAGSLIEAAPDGGVVMTTGSEEVLQRLFPGSSGPVTAKWFSGELLTGLGESETLAGFYLVVYAHYRIFYVQAGKVIRIDDHDRDWWYQQHPDIHPDRMRRLFSELDGEGPSS